MRFLFTTLQFKESDFYGRVGRELERRGHEVAHVTYSRQAKRALSRACDDVYCLPEMIAARSGRGLDPGLEAARIVREYETPTLRDIYRTDPGAAGLDERAATVRTIAHLEALEDVFDDVRPDVVLPEVGCETMRLAANLIALERGIPTFLLFYTIFDDRPLRVCVDRADGLLVDAERLAPLQPEQRRHVEEFIDEFIARDQPIRRNTSSSLAPGKGAVFARHLLVRAFRDHDNDYLRPGRWLRERLAARVRRSAAHALFEPIPTDPFVYFPLQVSYDYKIQRMTPHLYDQAAIVGQVARALPQGYEVVIKQHPVSIGRDPLEALRALKAEPNVRLVDPQTSSHELIRKSQGVATISSTVGLEALLHFKPVLTIGRPFYSGADVTLDVGSTAELREAVPRLLDFRPDHDRVLSYLQAAMDACRPGLPVLGASSDENAIALAGSLEQALAEQASAPARSSLTPG